VGIYMRARYDQSWLYSSCMRTTIVLCLAGGPHNLREAAVALLPPIPCVQSLVLGQGCLLTTRDWQFISPNSPCSQIPARGDALTRR
jgi:hypothetical protein